MMSCEEFTELASDYLDGRLPYGRKIGAWMHQALCVHCRRYLEQLATVVDLTGELPSPATGEEDISDVMDLFREQKKE